MTHEHPTWRRRTILRAAALALAVGGLVGVQAEASYAAPISPAPTPVLTGEPKAGNTVTINPGEWPEGTELHYEWILDGVTEPDANGPAWDLREQDVDVAFQVAVTGVKEGFDDTRVVSEPVVVLGEQQVLRPVPTIAGTARYGAPLVASVGAWDTGTTQAVQWLRGGTLIAGAISASYTPTLKDLGSPLAVRVTSTRPGYSKVVRTSRPTAAVALGTLAAGTVRIAGTPKVGRTLRSRVTGFDAGSTVAYRWLLGTKVVGTASSLRLTRKMVGKRVVLRAIATKSGYQPRTATSAPTARIRPAPKTRR